MGRALRMRKRKKTNPGVNFVVNTTTEHLELIKWMKEFGWKPSCRLVSAYFKNTGRGLMAKQNIRERSAIAKIPYKLLITVRTVLESRIAWLFTNNQYFTTQQVLSVFLVWENHLGEASFWRKYLDCLPKTFSCPAYCSDVKWLPSSLKEKVLATQSLIRRTYESVISLMGCRKCDHCDLLMSSWFTYERYLWAWCVVSTRAVYLCPKYNSQNLILLSDENNLALAPYVDLFNHSYATEVKAYVIESENVYQIETLTPFAKNREVFINYGPLSNDRLFVDYGFIIPSNIQDSVAFTFDTVLQVANELVSANASINKFRGKFLAEKKLFTNVSCHSKGLSWDCQALIYVFSCPADTKIDTIKQAVFTNKFKEHSWDAICRIGSAIVETKRDECAKEYDDLQSQQDAVRMFRECFCVAADLLNERMKLLNECIRTLAARTDE